LTLNDERDYEGDRGISGICVDEDSRASDFAPAVEGHQNGTDAERRLPWEEDLCVKLTPTDK
jgi:hypothetical protein